MNHTAVLVVDVHLGSSKSTSAAVVSVSDLDLFNFVVSSHCGTPPLTSSGSSVSESFSITVPGIFGWVRVLSVVVG